jgi:hypothetical protein
MSTGNADNFGHDASQIIVRKGAMEGIHKMAQLLNCRNIVEDNATNTTSADVTVIVGRDYRNQ